MEKPLAHTPAAQEHGPADDFGTDVVPADAASARASAVGTVSADANAGAVPAEDMVMGFGIRPTRAAELDAVMAIYARARAFMAEQGNPNQWGPTQWPPRALIAKDIAAAKSHVAVTPEGELAAVFFYDFGADVEPTYAQVEGGSWADASPYGVVHRIASAGVARGAGEACLRWALARSPHLRIDTHADNHPMQGLLAKLGFERRGIIYVHEDNDPRLAYEHV